MIEDDRTIIEMRNKARPERETPRTFMSISELKSLRLRTIRVSQRKLAEQLLRPETGTPVKRTTVLAWETGSRAVPLWAARRIRELAEAARRFDSKGGV